MGYIAMKKILANGKVQTLISVLVLIGSYIIGSMQGTFGYFLPFALLIFFIVEIFFVYQILYIPLHDLVKKERTSDKLYSLDKLKEYELTEPNIREIWIITNNLKMASSKEGFGPIIDKNIANGIRYKYFIFNNSIVKERAETLINRYKTYPKMLDIYILDEEPIFIDQDMDYDLFFFGDESNNKGFIGVTINNIRDYIIMPKDLFIKIKIHLDTTKKVKIN